MNKREHSLVDIRINQVLFIDETLKIEKIEKLRKLKVTLKAMGILANIK